MEKKNVSESANMVKEFNATAKAAKVQVKKAQSPIYFTNELNKLAKKNAYCDGKPVREIGKKIATIHGRKGVLFDICVFKKDFAGRSCLVSAYSGNMMPEQYKAENGAIITDDKGREIVLSSDGAALVTLVPVTLSLSGVLDAFCKIGRVEVKETAKAIKAEEKAVKQAIKLGEKVQKEIDRRRAGIIKDYNAGKFSEVELIEKLKAVTPESIAEEIKKVVEGAKAA